VYRLVKKIDILLNTYYIIINHCPVLTVLGSTKVSDAEPANQRPFYFIYMFYNWELLLLGEVFFIKKKTLNQVPFSIVITTVLLHKQRRSACSWRSLGSVNHKGIATSAWDDGWRGHQQAVINGYGIAT